MSYRNPPHFALVAFPAPSGHPEPDQKPVIIAVPEDVVDYARQRKWIVLAVDTDVLYHPVPVFNPPRISSSSPQADGDDGA